MTKRYVNRFGDVGVPFYFFDHNVRVLRTTTEHLRTEINDLGEDWDFIPHDQRQQRARAMANRLYPNNPTRAREIWVRFMVCEYAHRERRNTKTNRSEYSITPKKRVPKRTQQLTTPDTTPEPAENTDDDNAIPTPEDSSQSPSPRLQATQLPTPSPTPAPATAPINLASEATQTRPPTPPRSNLTYTNALAFARLQYTPPSSPKTISPALAGRIAALGKGYRSVREDLLREGMTWEEAEDLINRSFQGDEIGVDVSAVVEG